MNCPSYNGLVRFLLVGILLAASLPGFAARREDAVYVYRLFSGKPDCAEIGRRLKQLPLRPTVILEIEGEDGFLLDHPDGERQFHCALKKLRSSAHSVKPLLLQDAYFLDNPEEAARRAALLARFAKSHHGLIAGVHVDVEPYSMEAWSKGSNEERRQLLARLHVLLARLRRELNGLRLGAAIAWWYPVSTEDLPEAAPDALFGVTDDIYLLVYGEPGGPLIGGSAERVLSRVGLPAFFAGSGRVHVAVATYEFRSPDHLEAELAKIRRRLATYLNFGGTAVFSASTPFNAPLVRSLSGKVSAPDGASLEGVEVEAAGLRSRSDATGQFSLRGLAGFAGNQVRLLFRKTGFRTLEVSVALPAPGASTEIPPVTLEPEP